MRGLSSPQPPLEPSTHPGLGWGVRKWGRGPAPAPCRALPKIPAAKFGQLEVTTPPRSRSAAVCGVPGPRCMAQPQMCSAASRSRLSSVAMEIFPPPDAQRKAAQGQPWELLPQPRAQPWPWLCRAQILGFGHATHGGGCELDPCAAGEPRAQYNHVGTRICLRPWVWVSVLGQKRFSFLKEPRL